MGDCKFQAENVGGLMQLTMKRYRLLQDYTECLASLSGTVNKYGPNTNEQWSTLVKVIDGGLILRYQHWTLYQDKERKCTVRHEHHFKNVESRLKSQYFSGVFSTLNPQDYDPVTVERKARRTCPAGKHCWCGWKFKNKLISRSERSRRERQLRPTSRYMYAQISYCPTTNTRYRGQNSSWVIGKTKFGQEGWASVMTCWMVVGDCVPGSPEWEDVRHIPNCPLCTPSHTHMCNSKCPSDREEETWEIFEREDIFDPVSLLADESKRMLLKSPSPENDARA